MRKFAFNPGQKVWAVGYTGGTFVVAAAVVAQETEADEKLVQTVPQTHWDATGAQGLPVSAGVVSAYQIDIVRPRGADAALDGKIGDLYDRYQGALREAARIPLEIEAAFRPEHPEPVIEDKADLDQKVGVPSSDGQPVEA
jgi:hypothetical protein